MIDLRFFYFSVQDGSVNFTFYLLWSDLKEKEQKPKSDKTNFSTALKLLSKSNFKITFPNSDCYHAICCRLRLILQHAVLFLYFIMCSYVFLYFKILKVSESWYLARYFPLINYLLIMKSENYRLRGLSQ